MSNATPGKIKRLSVAVALSAKAMKKFRPSDIDQLKQLIGAAVGADPARGDQVAVVVRGFDADPIAPVAFYETGWFAMAVRYGTALLAMLLVLLLGVRPLIKALKRDRSAVGDNRGVTLLPGNAAQQLGAPMLTLAPNPRNGAADAAMLGHHVGIAQQVVDTKPADAVLALRQMLAPRDERATS